MARMIHRCAENAHDLAFPVSRSEVQDITEIESNSIMIDGDDEPSSKKFIARRAGGSRLLQIGKISEKYFN